MSWIDRFDAIFLVNLPRRLDRFVLARQELTKFSIPFTRIWGIAATDGRKGLYDTIISLFQYCISQNYKQIVVFEDDISFIREPHTVLDACLEELPADFDMLYLGCNIVQNVNRFYSPHLVPIARGLSTHAVAYSRACLQKIVALPEYLPIDVMYANQIHTLGKSYCCYPLVASQRQGYSDIMKQWIDWSPYIQERFLVNTASLAKKNDM